MSKLTKTALIALALAGTISGAMAQQADQTAPANQSQQVTPQQPQPARGRTRVATRQILLEPTAQAETTQVAAVTPAVDTQVQAPAVVQAPAQAQAPPAPAADVAPAPPTAPVAPPAVVVPKREFGGGYGYRQYGYSPRYAHYDNCHGGYGGYRRYGY